MNNQHRIDALRRLAERPGTPHEGEVAREMLRRAEAKRGIRILDTSIPLNTRLAEFLRKEDGAWARHMEDAMENGYVCDCGERYSFNGKCSGASHAMIRSVIRSKFTRGQRVFYNFHTYELNSPGTFIGFPVMPSAKDWRWVHIKFDHLKSPRDVPVWTAHGLHLFSAPLLEPEARILRGY